MPEDCERKKGNWMIYYKAQQIISFNPPLGGIQGVFTTLPTNKQISFRNESPGKE